MRIKQVNPISSGNEGADVFQGGELFSGEKVFTLESESQSFSFNLSTPKISGFLAAQFSGTDKESSIIVPFVRSVGKLAVGDPLVSVSFGSASIAANVLDQDTIQISVSGGEVGNDVKVRTLRML